LNNGKRFIKFTIPGEPKGKGRPKFLRQGNFVRTYSPETTVNYENWVKICFQEAKQEKLADNFQLSATIKCYFGIPKSVTKKNKESCLNGGLRPTKKPDIDNIAKIILDALNGLAYTDDKNIVDCKIEKWFAEEPRVEVEIWEI
jgi:Holliday junction resolvase RusA-like endonuclease